MKLAGLLGGMRWRAQRHRQGRQTQHPAKLALLPHVSAESAGLQDGTRWRAPRHRHGKPDATPGHPPLLPQVPAQPAGLPDGTRWRALGYVATAAPLAVSGPRGVACAVAGLQRALFLDLEEDEEGGDDEDDGAVLGED